MSEALAEEWYSQHFDHLSSLLDGPFHETLAAMRDRCPVAHSDQYGGFWVTTRYDDVLQVVQDWRTFSSAEKVSIPSESSNVPILPEEVDPPLHRSFRRLINVFLTPAAVAPYEEPTRRLAQRLIDGFIDDGRCEFMSAFAEQFPRLSFFDLVMRAPEDDIEWLSEMTRIADGPHTDPRRPEAWANIHSWIERFVEGRRADPKPGDIIDAILNADIDGRPITDDEILGAITILLFGGFGTTAAALGNAMIRLASEPGLTEELQREPEAIPNAIEELLRIDTPVVSLARTVTRDTVLGGQQIHKGDKVLFSMASANRDDAQFDAPASLDVGRQVNRHLAFGGGPHRCAGSNLARLNLRTAIEELTRRLSDIRIDGGPDAVKYRTSFTRMPTSVPITFRAADS